MPELMYVDAGGGDNPSEVIIGAAMASIELGNDAVVTLVGPKPMIESVLAANGLSGAPIEVEHCERVISMDAKLSPSTFKDDTSLATAARLAKENGSGFFGASNTALMAAIATRKVGMLPNVDMPGLATMLPDGGEGTLFIDAGGNANSKPRDLLNYGIMASTYCERVLGRSNPRIGLLSIGAEPTKGNTVTIEAHKLLASSGLNFIGNIEGDGLFFRAADAIITDGQSGNVALKTAEGAGRFVNSRFRAYLQEHPWAKLFALALKPMLQAVKNELDDSESGGAIMLGCCIPWVKHHGKANRRAVRNGIIHLYRVMQAGIISEMATAMAASTQETSAG